jgi:hypothetical protein
VKELVAEASFARNFLSDRFDLIPVVPNSDENLAALKTKRSLFRTRRGSELPAPTPEKIYSVRQLEPETFGGCRFSTSLKLPYMPWTTSLWYRGFISADSTPVWTNWLLDRAVHYVITKEPDESGLYYVGHIARFSFISARGKTIKEVEEKLMVQYRVFLEGDNDLHVSPPYKRRPIREYD